MNRSNSFTDPNGGMQLLTDDVVEYAMYLLDLDVTVKSWNPGMQRMKGYSVRVGEPVGALGIALANGRYEAEGLRVRKDETRF